MNNTQRNKLNMYEAVLTTLNTHSAVWNNMAAMNETVADLTGLLAQIRGAGAQLADSTTGLTQVKAEKKKQMANQAVALASVAFAYAAKQKDQALKSVLNYSFSKLYHETDNTSIDRCSAIYQRLLQLLPELRSYGVTETDLQNLQRVIEAFKQAIGDKGSIKSGSVVGNKTVVTLFAQTDELLKERMDKLVLWYKDTHPTFFNTYTHARNIIDLGGGKKTVKVEGKAAQVIKA